MKHRTIIVNNMMLYIEEDKEGYVSISSDGYKKNCDMWKDFMTHLLSKQTEDDLEMQSIMNAPRTGRGPR